MGGTRLMAVLGSTAFILSACGKEGDPQPAAAEAQVPERIFEGYPARIAAAITAREAALAQTSTNARGMGPSYIIRQTRTWKPGAVITVAFHGGSPTLRAQIEQAAREWVAPSIANVQLSFRDSDGQFRQWSPADRNYSAQIRIGFATDPENGGYWSAVGADSTVPSLFPASFQSLNLGGFDTALPPDWRTTVFHEFGHALGFEHEHQSPQGGCDFRFEDDPGYIKTQNAGGWHIPDANNRRPGLYTYLGGPKNNWSRAKVDHNLRQFAASSAFLLGTFDRQSIMLYAFDPFMFVKGDQSSCYVPRDNQQLSAQDKVGAARAYPANAREAERAVQEADAALSQVLRSPRVPADVRASVEQRLEALSAEAAR